MQNFTKGELKKIKESVDLKHDEIVPMYGETMRNYKSWEKLQEKIEKYLKEKEVKKTKQKETIWIYCSAEKEGKVQEVFEQWKKHVTLVGTPEEQETKYRDIFTAWKKGRVNLIIKN